MLNCEDVLNAFWESAEMHGYRRADYEGVKHNRFPCDLRCMFGDVIEGLHRSGLISDYTVNNIVLHSDESNFIEESQS